MVGCAAGGRCEIRFLCVMTWLRQRVCMAGFSPEVLIQCDHKTNASGQIHASILASEFQLYIRIQPIPEELHEH